jgi:hypothetical protein
MGALLAVSSIGSTYRINGSIRTTETANPVTHRFKLAENAGALRQNQNCQEETSFWLLGFTGRTRL